MNDTTGREATPDGREPKPCPTCGEVCVYDGWDHVHSTGLGIGSCPAGREATDRPAVETRRRVMVNGQPVVVAGAPLPPVAGRETPWRCEQHPDLTPGERFPSDGGGPYCLACSAGRETTLTNNNSED